jgi:uncharacterized protein YyaL (SSP411 family)
MAVVRVNRLADETSPYLLQHAHNPVDWFPWGPEALGKAREEDKPVFLSIGYAACHWCHVMERESFEDEGTAAFLNLHFVAVKVDREERPDIDGIYMDAVQSMTGQGGWPLSAFLTPEGRPFYAGTYFPPEPRGGMPSFMQVLGGIAAAWSDDRERVLEQAGRVTQAIERASQAESSPEPLTDTVTEQALDRLIASFDPRWGGFGGAPKFPQPMTLEFCLRMAVRGRGDAVEMVTTTLDRMAQGGIHDHVGGGFSRYSTDATWQVPHFEKMLYDNAQLAQLYTRSWLVTRRDRYRDVARDTLDYLLREMQHTEGGFYSSQDADSEGIEGKFFTWSWNELVELVGKPAASAFGASPEGNWEGTNVLWQPEPLPDRELDDVRRTLFDRREQRVRPDTDDKVLTSWNGLAIRAFAEAGRTFGDAAYVEAATRCADFVLGNLRDARGRLLRAWRGGISSGPAFVEDYALFSSALLTLYETTFELRWFTEAKFLADEMLRLFLDAERGGFFQTGIDADALVIRPKDLYDNALPSGNSAAADILLRLSLLTGEADHERAAASALRLVRDAMGQAPTAFGQTLSALDLYLGPSREVAIIGDPKSEETRAMVRLVNGNDFRPNLVLAVAAPGDAAMTTVPLLRDKAAMAGASATAYVCEHFVCKLPVWTVNGLSTQLAPN